MNALRRVVRALGTLVAEGILGLVVLAALLLSPFRMGRLLQRVSLPRYREHRLRTSLTVLGIALGVAVLIAVVLINRSILQSFQSTLDDISGKVDLQVAGSRGGFSESLFYDVKALPGVKVATPVLQDTFIIRNPKAHGDRVLLLGVDFLGNEDESFRKYDSKELEAIKEDPIAFLNSKRNIIISRQLADKLGLKLHDELILSTPAGEQSFDVWGFVEAEGVGRAFGGSVAVMYYQAMQVAMARGDNIDRVDVAVAPGHDVSAVSEAIAAKLGQGFDVERPERKNERVENMMVGLRTGLTLSSLIALLVGMFLIYNTMSISVVQRKRELGVLRALGTKRGEIERMLVLEGLLLGIVGSGLGVGLGVLLARGMLASLTQTVSEIYVQVATTDLHVDGKLLGWGFLLGLLGAALSAWVPAREATRVSPVETLRTGSLMTVAAPKRGLSTSNLLAGLMAIGAFGLLRLPAYQGTPVGAYAACMCVVGATALMAPRVVVVVTSLLSRFVGKLLGVEGRMGTANLPRDLRRASITSGALMIGVAMATSFGAFVGSFVTSTLEWVDQSIPADLFVTSSARFSGVKNVPMEDVLTEPFRQMPGIEMVERIRIADLDYGSTTVKLLSTDADIYVQRSKFSMLEGDADTAVAAFQRGAIMVSENFTRRYNKHVGDQLVLPTQTGTKSFEIAGVIIDYTSDMGTIFLDRPVYVRHWGDSQVDTYKIYVKPGAELEPVRQQIIERYGEKYHLFVLTNREFKQELVNLLDQVFSIMRALELVAILIAVLGVVNALLASVLDRVREIGVLRAIGMRRRQAMKMIVTEAGIIGLVSVVGGTLGGLVLGWVLLDHINLVQSGWYFPFRPAWQGIAETGLLVIVVSAVAGWYPAREAASLVVSDALEYE